MNKIDRLEYIFTKQIREKPTVEDFTREEYRELVRRIRDWCMDELRGGNK